MNSVQIKIVVIGVVVLFVLAIGWYISVHQPNNESIENAPKVVTQSNETAIKVPAAVPDQTGQYKDPNDLVTTKVGNNYTITAKTFGYEFQMPVSWYIQEGNTELDIHIANKKIDLADDRIAQPVGEVTLEIQYVKSGKPANLALIDYIKQEATDEGQFSLGMPSCPCTLVKFSNYNVVKTATSGGEGPEGPGYALQNPNHPDQFVRFLVYGTSETKAVEAIINSFKFTK